MLAQQLLLEFNLYPQCFLHWKQNSTIYIPVHGKCKGVNAFKSVLKQVSANQKKNTRLDPNAGSEHVVNNLQTYPRRMDDMVIVDYNCIVY